MDNLIFHNPLSSPLNILVKTDAEGAPLIMEWYGSHYAGDNYTVSFNGRNVPMDINGCPIKPLNELREG